MIHIFWVWEALVVIIHEAQLSPLRVVEASIHKLHHKCSVRSTDVTSIEQVVLGSCRNKIYIVSVQTVSTEPWHWEW